MKTSSPTREKQLSDFERRHGPLPPDMRVFYQRCNGAPAMGPHDVVRLWQLDEIKPAREEVSEEPHLILGVEDQLVFADWMIWTFAFVIDIRGDGRVSLIGDGPPRRVAVSFSEFVTLVENDDGSHAWLEQRESG
jgi:hypothetical protein